MYIIAGLGNPGRDYEGTRHNVGFLVVDFLAQRLNIDISKKKFKALSGEGSVNGEKIVILKPQTYMNLSGESISEALNWHKIDTSNLIIVYDDIDLDVGKIRIRPHGSAGTHNGMRSIVGIIGSEKFPRVRIGIGKPTIKGFELADYVLGKFSSDEKKQIQNVAEQAADAVITIIEKGIQDAMNKFN